jgi:hypothetical protein
MMKTRGKLQRLFLLALLILFQGGCSQNLVPDESVLSPNLFDPAPIVNRPQFSDINEPIFREASSWDSNHPYLFGFEYLRVAESWAYLPNDVPSLTVAVIDTGIDTSHPEFQNKLWINADEIPGNGQDDDGNGYVDDVHGYNFVDGNSNISDDNGHGSHVTGTIAAALNNQGIMGVAPFVRVMVLKTMGSNGSGEFLDVMTALEYAGENGADIVNLSLGAEREAFRAVLGDEDGDSAFFNTSNDYDNIIDQLSRGDFGKPVAVVVASGNSGAQTRNSTPGNARRAITVSAQNPNGQRCGFANDGWKTDFSMPGCGNGVPGILSVRSFQCGSGDFACNLGPDLSSDAFFSGENGSRLSRLNGTSQAAPHAAGLIALGMAKRPDAHLEILRQSLRSAGSFYRQTQFPAQTLSSTQSFGSLFYADTFLQQLNSEFAFGGVGARFTSPGERPMGAGSGIQLEAELVSDQGDPLLYDIVQITGTLNELQDLDLSLLNNSPSNQLSLDPEGIGRVSSNYTLSDDPYDLFILRAARPSNPERHFYDFLMIEKP